jgi:hypothetical protein
MEKKVFNFYGIQVSVETACSELAHRLSSDFSFFEKDLQGPDELSIFAFSQGPDFSQIRGKRFFKTSKVDVHEEYPIRYSRYGSSGMSVWDQAKNQACFYAEEVHLLHELVYLFILSRVGKRLDMKSLHRVHAACLNIDTTLVIAMMSSGVGKSTLASFLLEHAETSLYSDDSPLIDSEGEVLPFPVRFGLEKDGLRPKSWEKHDSYSLKRREYGIKTLYSLDELKTTIGASYRKKVILVGKRSGKNKSEIIKGSVWSPLSHVIKEGLIGVGLPILLEYFWQSGFEDFSLKTRIFFSRLRSFWRLLRTSEVYEISLGNDPVENAQFLIDWCKTTKGAID